MSSDHEGRRGSDESDRSGSPDSRSGHGADKPASRSRSRSYHSDKGKYRDRSRSRSHSRGHRRRKYSYSKSRSRSHNKYSRSRSRSPYHKRSSRYSRSRSRDRSPHHRDNRYNNSRRSGYNRSYSRSPPRYRGRDTSPMSNRRRHVGNRDKPEPTRCLGIFGLSLYTQERDLRDVFSRYGQIEELQVVLDRQSGRSRGFAFIYFKTVDDAIEAKDRCAGQEIDGRRIRVDYSITERAHTPTPGIYLGKPTTPPRESSSSRGYSGGGGGRSERGERWRSPSPYQSRKSSRYSRSRSRSWSPRRY